MATAAKDYYRVLGLTDDADPPAIEQAYRELLEQIDEELELAGDVEELHQLRREATEAYQVLRNAEQRRAYDELRREAAWWSDFDDDPLEPLDSDDPAMDEDTFLEAVLRRFLNTSESREVLDLLLPFEVSALGGRARLRMPMRSACPACGGTGGEHGVAYACPACGGGRETSASCKTCSGHGWLVSVSCPRCNGEGWLAAFGTFSIEIPAGIDDGTLLPFPGFGGATSGSEDGPRYVRVKVSEHPFFSRHGQDVHCRVPISEKDAKEGSTIVVRTLRGRRQRLEIPPNTSDGTVVRLEGEGIEVGGERGDQLIEINVKLRPGRKAGGSP